MTVEEMLNKMPATELIEWKAFFSLEAKENKNSKQQKEMMNRLAGKKGRRARK